MEDFKILLRQIASINRKYNDIAQITGENFNIFRVLGLESSEVRLHSNLLAELLNPQGSHGLGTIFLTLLVTRIGFPDFEIKSAGVEIEKHIGYINNEGSHGGRIDILIDDKKGRGIVIENKIYAADQSKQLERYHNYCQLKFNKGYRLIYLTLDGRETTERLIKDNPAYKAWSYKDLILDWLEDCKKEAVNHSLLRETISQYAYLIKYLTGITINKKMEEEAVKSIIESEANFLSAHIIKDSLEEAYLELFKRLESQLIEKTKGRDLILDYKMHRRENAGFSFFNEMMKQQNLRIRFEFDTNGNTNFFFGFNWQDEKGFKNGELKEQLKMAFKNEFGIPLDAKFETTAWPCWNYFSGNYRHWNRNTFVDIMNGKLADTVVEQTNTMIQIINSLLK